MPIQSVHRLLSCLEEYDIIYKNPETKKYSLSLKMIGFSQSMITSLPLWQHAVPFMKKIVSQTGESVFLTVKEGIEGVIIGGFYNHPDFQEAYPLGKRTPLSGGTPQKVMLAFMDGQRQARMIKVLKDKGQLKFPNELQRELLIIKEKGFAVTEQGDLQGNILISAPVFSWEGDVIAAITMILKKGKFASKELNQMASLTRQTAESLSEEMGWIKML